MDKAILKTKQALICTALSVELIFSAGGCAKAPGPADLSEPETVIEQQAEEAADAGTQTDTAQAGNQTRAVTVTDKTETQEQDDSQLGVISDDPIVQHRLAEGMTDEYLQTCFEWGYIEGQEMAESMKGDSTWTKDKQLEYEYERVWFNMTSGKAEIEAIVPEDWKEQYLAWREANHPDKPVQTQTSTPAPSQGSSGSSGGSSGDSSSTQVPSGPHTPVVDGYVGSSSIPWQNDPVSDKAKYEQSITDVDEWYNYCAENSESFKCATEEEWMRRALAGEHVSGYYNEYGQWQYKSRNMPLVVWEASVKASEALDKAAEELAKQGISFH